MVFTILHKGLYRSISKYEKPCFFTFQKLFFLNQQNDVNLLTNTSMNYKGESTFDGDLIISQIPFWAYERKFMT